MVMFFIIIIILMLFSRKTLPTNEWRFWRPFFSLSFSLFYLQGRIDSKITRLSTLAT